MRSRNNTGPLEIPRQPPSQDNRNALMNGFNGNNLNPLSVNLMMPTSTGLQSGSIGQPASILDPNYLMALSQQMMFGAPMTMNLPIQHTDDDMAKLSQTQNERNRHQLKDNYKSHDNNHRNHNNKPYSRNSPPRQNRDRNFNDRHRRDRDRRDYNRRDRR